MIAKVVAAVALLLAPLDAARAQFVIPGFSIMTPAQQNRQVVPYKRALTFCVIKQALNDSAAAVAFRDGSFETYVVTLIDRCPDDRRNLEQMYDRTYGQGQADPFINGAYAADLPEAVLKRIRPQLQAKVDDLNREEAARKADEDARAKQAEADQQLATARAAQEEATAKADTDRAEAQERVAAQQAEAERLKQVEVANGAAKLLAGKALDCGHSQLKSLVRSGETAEVLASAVMTMCDTEIGNFVDAGVKEYNLEHQIKDDDPADGLLREKLKADTRDHLVALAVQAKAGVGDFAPASSN